MTRIKEFLSLNLRLNNPWSKYSKNGIFLRVLKSQYVTTISMNTKLLGALKLKICYGAYFLSEHVRAVFVGGSVGNASCSSLSLGPRNCHTGEKRAAAAAARIGQKVLSGPWRDVRRELNGTEPNGTRLMAELWPNRVTSSGIKPWPMSDTWMAQRGLGGATSLSMCQCAVSNGTANWTSRDGENGNGSSEPCLQFAASDQLKMPAHRFDSEKNKQKLKIDNILNALEALVWRRGLIRFPFHLIWIKWLSDRLNECTKTGAYAMRSHIWFHLDFDFVFGLLGGN